MKAVLHTFVIHASPETALSGWRRSRCEGRDAIVQELAERFAEFDVISLVRRPSGP